MAKVKPKDAARQVLDEVVPVEVGGGPREDVSFERPSPTDPSWTPWVLAQLEEGEKWEGEDGKTFPYTKGLRRFARQLLGAEDMKTGTTVVSVLPNGPGEPPTVTVEHVIEVYHGVPGIPVHANGVACRGPFNMGDSGKAAVFPGETADTVAEGRALTRLLGLNTVTKDEMKGGPLPSEVQTSPTITAAQLKQLESICKRAGVNVGGLAAAGTKRRFSHAEEMPADVFFAVAKYLDGFMKRAAAGTLTDDDEVFRTKAGPFDPNWRG